MEKLSYSVEKLLERIRSAPDGKIPITNLNEDDKTHLGELYSRNYVRPADPVSPENDPNSPIVFLGFFYNSAEITTLGVDYLKDRSREQREKFYQFGRDVLMLFLSALISLFVSWLFNQSAIRANVEEPVSVAENSPALVTPAPSFNPAALE